MGPGLDFFAALIREFYIVQILKGCGLNCKISCNCYNVDSLVDLISDMNELGQSSNNNVLGI